MPVAPKKQRHKADKEGKPLARFGGTESVRIKKRQPPTMPTLRYLEETEDKP